MKTTSESGGATFFGDAPAGTTLCSFLTWRFLISQMDGAARSRNTNTPGLPLNESMPNKGAKPRKMGAGEGSIAINAPIATVYKRWLAFEDYPKFITPIKRVRKLDKNHFVASLAFNGKHYEATLEIMLCVPERRLAWRTISNGHAQSHLATGVVSFATVSNHGVHVTLKLTSSFGGNISHRVEKYLRNFKRLIETRRHSSKAD